ncbi:hypothetical protein J421_1381 [Gemmatirosa kalamazoonensis]|uniref:Uncharacterized protein n=1 Tax=Gemmatirosa kalamazoonensis TaxID=861299 RepID=W0RHN8_9BACT|nr:hypothetical protein [Gemmatirosa kalamazoonensis]AHG88918.1 hypothetical protein J421_1381 [Gemmatirosa kalamazoonensis]
MRGDSAALASLPPALAEAFAVRAVLTREALRDTDVASCEPLLRRDTSAVRRRLRARLADGSRTVLFVRAARDTIRRVELVRRARGGGQRGFIWDASTDAAESVEWRVGVTRPEVTTLPRGGPVPRALRALGRQLLALPCDGR